MNLQVVENAVTWFGDWLRSAIVAGFKLHVLNCPPSGSGVHRWLFVCAMQLHRFGLDEDNIFELLEVLTEECGREVSNREIQDAVRNSRPESIQRWCQENKQIESGSVCSKTSRIKSRSGGWPARNYVLIQKIGLTGPSVEQLRELSPWQFPNGATPADVVLDLLFPGDPLLCCGWEFSRGNTMPKSWWLSRLSDVQFVVPSPMIDRKGLTKDGRRSVRTLNNTGPRRYLVVEFDFKEKAKDGSDTADAAILRSLAVSGRNVQDLCAALAVHLAAFAPLVIVVSSGGKSLHAWFSAHGVDKGLLDRFMRYAVSIGADPMTYTACQFVRLPGGVRDNGKSQEVIFFDPSLIPNI